MTRYDKILSKITPTFYKLVQYNEYISNAEVYSYLKSLSLPPYEYNYISTHGIIKEMDYFYYCAWYNKYTYSTKSHVNFDLTYESSVLLTTTNKILSTHYENFTIDNFIVNIIINKFSFENMLMLYAPFLRFADFLKLLVGKDMYETLKDNVK